MIEKQVLEILENNSKTSIHEIAKKLGITSDEVEIIIKKAEQQKIILKYKTVVDWAKLGSEKVLALIEIKASPRDNKSFDDIAASIYRFPQVRSVYLASGTYDMAALVADENMHDLAVFVSEKLARVDTIQGTVTHFLLKKYKEDGEIFVGNNVS